MIWTDAMVTQLRELVAEGHSNSIIARKMRMGMSRSAIIGKRDRLGLSGKGQPKFALSKGRPQKTAKPVVKRHYEPYQPPVTLPPLPVVNETVTSPSGVPAAVWALGALQCKFPIGHPSDADFRFCTSNRGLVTPYCPEHMAIAYQPASERKKHNRREEAA